MSYEAASKTECGPSNIAGAKIKPHVTTLKDRVLTVLRRYPSGLTADEVAEFCGASMLAIRPRVSELCNDGLIEKTAHRRKNASGMSATIWRVRHEPATP